VALRDLELRGAGSVLGANQSGFAHAIGIDAYLRLLEQTVRRLRHAGTLNDLPDPEISLAGSAFLPDAYVSDSGQKLHLYRRMSKMRRRAEVDELRRELEDRFGSPPPEVERLLDATTLRIQGRELQVERIMVRGRTARLNFHAGVVPRLQSVQKPLRDRQVMVEVRRMAPLSLRLEQIGPEPLTETLMRALDALLADHAESAA
jgi:transcription-repair coupling factor (superfamily II helicase)